MECNKIVKAAELIWYDNGMINQFEPIEIKLDCLNKWLDGYDQLELSEINSELMQLSDEDINTICTGEELDQQRLASPRLNDFLGLIFDEEYLSK